MGTRISDLEEENNKVVGREGARQPGRGLFLFPCPRASLGSFTTALGRGRSVEIIAAASLVASCLLHSLVLLLYPTRTPVIYPPLLSILCSESLFHLLPAPSYSCLPALHTDTGVGPPFGQLSLDCLAAGARLPYQVLHISFSAQSTCNPNTIGLCLR